MKKIVLLAMLSSIATVHAAVLSFDLSPPGTDNAAGLSPLNETPPVTNSIGSGNEIGSGITFDTITSTLNLSVGYGSAFGFTNLTGPATAAHIHGPAPTNTPAPVLIDLAPYNVLATNPANGGSIVGSLVLSSNDAVNLEAGLLYMNVHTAANPAGEIRGQLIPVNTLPTVVCPASTNAQCAGPGGTPVTLTTEVSDADGDALTVVWTANGVAMQTNTIAAGTSTNVTAVSFAGLYLLGTNYVTITVTDAFGGVVTCNAVVAVIDTLPPVITSASVTPNELWPPNHKMVPVQVSVTAVDICGDVTTSIVSVQSSQSPNAKGSGKKSTDWKITGNSTVLLRAERSGTDKAGRTYTITVQAVDDSGNIATTNLTVLVPHSQGTLGNTNGPGQLPPPAQGPGNHSHNKKP